MIYKEPRTLYSLDEVVLIPAVISKIRHRYQCSPYQGESSRYPLFISPMSCLTNENNYSTFLDFNLNPVLPRTVSWRKRLEAIMLGKWVAIGLEEGQKLLAEGFLEDVKFPRICIDMANGHMEDELKLAARLKSIVPHSQLMVGNIARPETFEAYADVGVDYARLGIGSGQVCTTSVQTGIHYPMASLISDCYQVREKFTYCTKIVPDGGFSYIDQIVKALALGADYVMIGKIAASFPEACGKVVDGKREYYGMSTEKAQREMHPEPDYVPKHTEGTVRWVPVRESTKEWIKDFDHALRSSMSYSNAYNLREFCGQVDWCIQNPTTFNAYIKS